MVGVVQEVDIVVDFVRELVDVFEDELEAVVDVLKIDTLLGALMRL